MKKLLFSLLTVGIMVLAALPVGAAPALADKPGSGGTTIENATVSTDKEDYAPEETVQISGSGFDSRSDLTIKVIRPDGSLVTGDGSFAPWPAPYDGVKTNKHGSFTFDYVLDGIEGEYEIQVLDGPWDGALDTVLATHNFHDSRNPLWATLNGGAQWTSSTAGDPVTVSPGATIAVVFNVQVTPSSTWGATEWRFDSGNWTCDDHMDHPSGNAYTETFNITAPAAPGTYNLTLYARSSCGNGSSGEMVLTDAVTVTGTSPSRTITSATLDGASSVTVAPGASITAGVTVETVGGVTWGSTSWRISTSSPGSMTCQNTTNHNSDGTFTESFNITAPTTPGTYNVYFEADNGDSCSGSGSTTYTMTNAVTVQQVTPAPNPTLDEACGYDLVLVLDMSASIQLENAVNDVKNAAHAFVNAFLPGTPSLMGLVSFNTTATVLSDLTSDYSALNSDINALNSNINGYTNWQDALNKARGLLEKTPNDRDDSQHPDVIVIVTDGDPTASSAGPSNTTQPNIHLAPAILAANVAKTSSSTQPIRIVAVGVGPAFTNPDSLSRLEDISGNNVSPPDTVTLHTDVILGQYTELADMLAEIASKLGACTITATNPVVPHSTGNIASVDDAGMGATYSWEITSGVGTGTITAGQGTNQITWMAGDIGTTTIKATVTNQNHCSGTCTIDVTVSEPPTCFITAPASVCDGSTSNSASGPAGMTSYSWSITGGTITGGGTTQTVTFTAGTGSTVHLSLTIHNGGSQSTCSKDIPIIAKPDCTITAPASTCAGATGLSASTTAGLASYSWAITGGVIDSGATTNAITWHPTSTGTVTLKVDVSNSSGCASHCEKVVTVNGTNPDCTITAPASTCAGATGLSASTTAGLASYDWDITGGVIDTGDGTNAITWHPTSTGTVTLKVDVSNSSGCASYCEKAVTVSAKPVCTITAPDSVCNGFSDTASVASAGEGATYEWTVTNGEVTNGQGTNQITFTVGSEGTMILHVTVTKNGCSSSCDRSVTVETDCCSNIFESCGHRIEFVSHSFDGTNSTWTYLVTSGGGSTCNAISHWVMAQCDCDSVVSVSEGYECGQDPTTGVTGIKFAVGYDDYATRTVSFVLSGDYPECCVDIAIKAGTSVFHGQITGPCCCPDKPDCLITAPGTACAGATGLAASVASAGDGATYAWTIDNGSITSAANIREITFSAGTAGTTTLHVTVTNGSGCSSICDKTVTVNAKPDCLITAPGTACAGATGLAASVADAGGSATYAWTIDNGSITSAATIREITFSAGTAGTTTLHVTVSNGAGCSATCDKTVTVNAKPDCLITAPGTACAGATGLAASVADAGGSAVYAWTIDNGSITSAATIREITFSAGTAGTTTLHVTVSNGAGCSATCDKTVTVNAKPDCLITAPGTACAGATGLAASVASAGDGATYAWTIDNGSITSAATIREITFSAGTAGTTTLHVTVSNGAGCSATCDKTVTVNAKPDCLITAPGTACAGATGLAASVADAGGSATYAWTIDNGSITSAATIREITFSAGTAGTTTLHVTVSNGAGCSATCDKTVTLSAKPDCLITAPGTACAGATGLAASVASAGDGATYAWTIDNGSITSAATIREITFSAGTAGTTTLHVTVSNGAGCSATCDKTVTVNAKPDCLITAPGTACAGATGLAASVADAGGSAVYAWTIDNGSITSAANIREITFSAGTAGTTTLHVTVTNGSGCSSICDKTVTLSAKPDCLITAPGTACAGATGLAASVASAGDGATYAWTIDNGSITSAATIREITFSAGTAGTTTLHVTVSNGAGCSATCDKTVTVNAKPDCTITAPSTACSGATGLAASVADAGGSAVYAWTIDNGSITSAATIREITFSAGTAGTTTLHVTVSNGAGCSATCDKTVTVNAKPDCLITAPGTACAGATGLAASVADAGGSAVYAWTIDNGSITSAATIREITFSAGTAGTTTLHVTVSNGAGCSATCDKTVTVNAKPDCLITAPGTACAGATGLAASVASAGDGATYAWTIDNGSITSAATIREITFSAGTTGTTTLHVTVTSGSGCSSICDKTVTLSAKPDCLITAPGTACAGATGLAASVASAGDGATYAWTIDNGSITSAATIREITFSAGTAGTTTLHVTVTSGSGCSSICDKTVTLSAKPDCLITAPGTACAGATGLAASVADAGGSAVYAWTIDNGSITSAANIREITFSAGTAGTTTLHVTVTNGSGCSSICDKTVTLSAKPDCTITAPSTACSGATGLAASVADAGAGATYAWTIDNGSITSAANIRQITFSAGTAGTTTLHVTVTNGSGCSSICDKTVTLSAKPDCLITAPGTACAGATGLAASVASAGDGATYAWTIDNGSITSAATIREITFSAGTAGTTTLHVTVTSGSGCSSICDKTVTLSAKPDCTITAPSTVCAGFTGNIASVISAGEGATYIWTIGNGTITAGQGTNSITFTAGSVGTMTLSVVVTTASGCSCESEDEVITVLEASISGRVWLDEDRSGTIDVGESGIYHIDVYLLNAADKSIIATRETDVNGYYLFSGLDTGDYIVDVNENDEHIPSGYFTSTYNDLTSVSLTGCENIIVNFGFGPDTGDLNIIGDLVWEDANWNGVYDEGELGIPWITLILKDRANTTILNTTETDSFGNYFFYGLSNGDILPDGDYRVEVDLTDPDLASYTATTPTINDQASVHSNYLDADFGFSSTEPPPPIVSVGDASTCEGVAVTLTADTTGSLCTVSGYQWYEGASSSGGMIISGATSATYQTTVAGDYTCKVTCLGGSSNEDYGTVTVLAGPTADAGPNETIAEGGSVAIGGNPTGSGGVGTLAYSWWPTTGLSESDIANPTASPGDDITYTVTVTDQQTDCQDTDSMTVTVTGGGGGGGPPPEPACALEINMLGEVVHVDVDCCDNSTYESYVIYDPSNQNFLSIDRSTPVICGDCVGCGAYPVKIEVTESEDPPPEPDGAQFVGPVYDFIGYRNDVACNSITFGKPVVLLFGYDPDNLPADTTSVVVAFYNAEDNTWEDLPADSGRVAEVGEATALTTHFSQFVVLAKIGEETAPPPPPPVTPPTPATPPTPEVASAHFFTNGLAITPSREQVGTPFAFVLRTGENVTITANIGNDGGQQGNYLADLEINGNSRSTREVTLLPGQSQELVFTINGNASGLHTVRIGDLTGEFETKVWVNWWLIGGLAAALGVGIWVAWYYRRRKMESGS